MPIDIELYPDVSFWKDSRDLRVCSPDIIEYAVRVLVREIPAVELGRESDHKKMYKLFRDRVLFSQQYSFDAKMQMLEKINMVQEELKK